MCCYELIRLWLVFLVLSSERVMVIPEDNSETISAMQRRDEYVDL